VVRRNGGVGMVEPPPHSESHLVVSLQAINGS
jgi:hypothetical protein